MATLNQRIAMSMLRQCAFVWEHCCMAGEVGSFTLRQILDESGGNLFRKRKIVTGGIVRDFDKCYNWELFGSKFYPIEGFQSLHKESKIISEWIVTLQIDTFRCSYPLNELFARTYDFCKANCPSLMKQTVFRFTEDRECITDLPVLPVLSGSPTKSIKPKHTLSPRRVRLRVLSPDDDFDID